MQLRDYQTELIDRARESLKHYNSTLVQAPTGSGKTAMLVHMMKTAANRGKSSMFCVHQNELLGQTSRALWEQQLSHGVIAAGKVYSALPVQVASVQTLVRRLSRYTCPDLIIIDEAHRAAADTYRRILDAYPDARVIGLTATPERTDGKGLKDIFDDLVEGPTIPQLIEAGYLCDYEIFAPPSTVDLSGVHKVAGDYNRAEAAAAVDRPTITGDAVQHYKRLAYGKRCVAMCVTVDHARHVEAQYRAEGVPAETIEGNMSSSERDGALARLRSGETLVVCNVQLMIEGVDIPSIEVIQWLRPTQSLIVWMQGNGRGFRPEQGKEKLLILDHVGNSQRHGLPDDEREWSLEGRKGRKRKADDDEPGEHIQQCDQCYAVFRPGPSVCPSCGAPVHQKPAREIEQVDGELARVDIEQERKRRKQLQGAARSLEQLVEVGRQQGMRNPAGWAANVYASRQGRKAKATDYQQAKRAMTATKEEGLI